MAFKGLKRLAGGGMLLLELRGLRRETTRLADTCDRIATALETQNAHRWPQAAPHAPAEDLPAALIEYVDGHQAEVMMQIEMDLTRATGLPPSEEAVMAEWERRRDLAP